MKLGDSSRDFRIQSFHIYVSGKSDCAMLESYRYRCLGEPLHCKFSDFKRPIVIEGHHYLSWVT